MHAVLPAPKLSLLLKRSVLLCLLAATSFAWAQKPDHVTTGEMALLPPYCPDTQLFKYGDRYSNPSPNANYWVGSMGETFWAMHHYCWALIRMNRAKQIGLPGFMREGHIKGALADYEYVLNNAAPGFPLAPEVLTKLGDAHLLLGATGAAMDAYARARQLKPDYWPPYMAWAEVLVKIGKRQEAIALVDEVLKLQPDDAVLQRRYKLLLAVSSPTGNASSKVVSGVPTTPSKPSAPGSAARAAQ
jgi:hypothetical protein